MVLAFKFMLPKYFFNVIINATKIGGYTNNQ